jgi:type IV pilus assembly protein PilB
MFKNNFLCYNNINRFGKIIFKFQKIPMLKEKQIIDILVKEKVINMSDTATQKKEAKKQKLSFIDYLIKNKISSEEDIYQALAKSYKIPFVNLKDIDEIKKEALEVIPEPIAQAHQIIAFDLSAKQAKVACTDPEDIQTFNFLKKKLDQEIKIYITTPSSIDSFIKNYHQGIEKEFEKITGKKLKKSSPTKKAGTKATKEEKKKGELEELANDLPIIKIVDTLLEYAIFENASDIHIEPQEKEIVVRYRVDGILREVMQLPKKSMAGIIARIKILSNLKIDEHRIPQDGRFKIENEEYKIAFRVSIIPVFDGEKIVMRLLNESKKILTLEELGFMGSSLEKIERAIKKPNGMVLVTGPTGSGKTTTLYTVLNVLNKPGVNITTIEDPVEYRMEKVNQSQINAKIGYTFASGLRAFLRQDPDVIMVGEIRDTETAEIATNAAMTGHLVLSTLHTNDAATTLPRLHDMNIEPFLIASTVNVIIAQRLVRRICKNCIMSYKLDSETIKQVEKQFDIKDLKQALYKNNAIKTDKDALSSLLFYKGKGCKHCGDTGYKGRAGIYEVLEIDEKISPMIIKNAGAEELNKKAKESGMTSMSQDGFIKAKKGVTTIEEILRVTKK